MNPVHGALRVLLLSLLLAAGAAAAKSKEQAEALALALGADTTAAEFQAQRERIETAVADAAYKEMNASGREDLRDTLERIGLQLETGGSLAAMDETSRKAVAEDQAAVNALLKQAHDDSRLVCAREQVIGSNRSRTVCLTLAQRRRDSVGAREQVRQND